MTLDLRAMDALEAMAAEYERIFMKEGSLFPSPPLQRWNPQYWLTDPPKPRFVPERRPNTSNVALGCNGALRPDPPSVSLTLAWPGPPREISLTWVEDPMVIRREPKKKVHVRWPR